MGREMGACVMGVQRRRPIARHPLFVFRRDVGAGRGPVQPDVDALEELRRLYGHSALDAGIAVHERDRDHHHGGDRQAGGQSDRRNDRPDDGAQRPDRPRTSDNLRPPTNLRLAGRLRQAQEPRQAQRIPADGDSGTNPGHGHQREEGLRGLCKCTAQRAQRIAHRRRSGARRLGVLRRFRWRDRRRGPAARSFGSSGRGRASPSRRWARADASTGDADAPPCGPGHRRRGGPPACSRRARPRCLRRCCDSRW